MSLDRLLERDVLPDTLLRLGIRRLLRQRLREEKRDSVEAQLAALQSLVAQLRASLSYLERVGVPRIEDHTAALAQQLYAGLVQQGYKMFTPPGNRSAIVTFYITRPADAWRAALDGPKIDVTIRNAQVRVSPALFNNADEIDQLLSITKKLS